MIRFCDLIFRPDQVLCAYIAPVDLRRWALKVVIAGPGANFTLELTFNSKDDHENRQAANEALNDLLKLTEGASESD